MERSNNSISPEALYARIGSEAAPIIVDVRRDADFSSAERLLADACHCSPDNVEAWRTMLPSDREVVTSRHDLSPQCGGLFAISLGLSSNFPDDHQMPKHGMVVYDALYTWCRSLQAETHNWPARAVGA